MSSFLDLVLDVGFFIFRAWCQVSEFYILVSVEGFLVSSVMSRMSRETRLMTNVFLMIPGVSFEAYVAVHYSNINKGTVQYSNMNKGTVQYSKTHNGTVQYSNMNQGTVQ